MAEFDQRISQIKQSIEGLTSSLRDVESAVSQASKEFDEMARNAENINQVASSVTKLERLVNRLENTPFAERLKDQISQMNQELQKLDTSRLQTVTSAIQAQAQAQRALNQTQVNLNGNFRRTQEIVTQMISSLGSLSQAADSLSQKTATALSGVGGAIGSITGHEQQIQAVVASLNTFDPGKYDQTAKALVEIANAAERISKADLSQLSTVSRAPRVQRQPAPPGPNKAAIAFAQEQGIDLSQFEGKVTKADLQRYLKEQAPATTAVTAPIATSELIEKATKKYASTVKTIQEMDKALAEIQKIKEQTFEKVFTESGAASIHKEDMRAALVGGDASKKFQLSKELLSNNVFLDALNKYNNIVESEYIETGVKKFETVSLQDVQQLKAFQQLREVLHARATEARKALESQGVAAENLPNLSLAGSIGRTATGFSERVYRPASYGLSQFGSLLNSITQISQGLNRGGPGGFLDAVGGGLKGINTLNNSSAYFGWNFLPKGFGEMFSNSRSQTLMDLVRAVTGMTTGYGQGPLNVGLRGIESRITTKEGIASNIQNAIAYGNNTPAQLAALEAELTKVRAELSDLRKAANAYKQVLVEEARREAEDAEHSKNSGGFTSTGAQLGNRPNARLRGVDYERTANDLLLQLTERETLLSMQAKQALQKFGIGTGFAPSGDVIVANDVRKLVKTAYNENAVPQGQLQGVNIPVYADESRRDAVYTSVASARTANIAQTLVHEISHDLIEQTRQNGSGLYTTNANGGGARFTNTELDQLATLRKFQLNTTEGRKELFAATRGTSGEESRMLNATQTNNDYRRYLFNPSEIFAHISEALISGNTQLESALRKVYGPELFEKVQRELATELPQAFSDEPLKLLRSRFHQLETEISQNVGTQNSFSGIIEGVQKLAQEVLEAFKQVLGPLGDQVATSIETFFKSLGISGDSASKLQASLAPNSGIAFNSAVQFLPNNVRRLLETTNANASGANLISAIGGGGNIGGALQNLDIKGILTSYAVRLFKEDNKPPLGLIGQALQQSKLVDKVFEGIANTVERTLKGQNQLGPLSGLKQRGVQELLRLGLETQLPASVSFRDELNDFVRQRTGKNIQAGSFQQSMNLNPVTGMTEFSLSAKTADGAVVSLNGHLDEFGRKKITDPTRGMSEMTRYLKEFFTAIPRQLGYQLTYQMTDSVQRALSQILSIQDELAEISNMAGAGPTGPVASQLKYDFLHRSVATAQFTGQGFDEAVQTNLKNYKILGGIQNQDQRADLANQLSKVQLGAQTAFGISLEQSLEAIPAILTSIGDSMEGIDDPAKRTALSIKELQEVMDRMVVAQRESGASGEDMIEVFSRLSASAKEYGLTNKELINLVASSSVAIGKGPEENANALRTLLEGTYSQENQGALRQFGITTKSFNTKTNQIENRDFNDVMKDLVAFITNPETKGQAPQLFQVFGGPKLAPDIGKAIRGYAANEQRLDTVQQQKYTGDNFDQLVEQKSQNLQGSLKKLGAAGTELFNTFLVGTGAMDSATTFFDKLADSAGRLTEFFSQHGKEIKQVFDFISNYLKYNLIGALAKDVNIFSPIAKAQGALKTSVSAAISTIVDFGFEGERSSNKVLKSLQLVGKVFNNLEGSIAGSTAAIKNLGMTSSTAINPSIRPSVNAAQVMANPYADMDAAQLMANASIIPNTPAKNRFGRFTDFIGGTFNRLSTANPTFGGISSWWANNKSPLRNAAVTVGDSAGSMLAPVGYDLITGGLNKSNVVNTVGAGLAGTFLGAITASPQLGLVGYGMAKSFLDNIDFSKFFGASQKEMESFGAAIAEGIRKANLTPEQRALEAKNDQAGEAQTGAIQQQARESFGKLDSLLGLSNFDQQFAQFTNAQSRANRALAALPGGGVSSSDIEQYRRLIVNQERPRGFWDREFIAQQNDRVMGGQRRFENIASVYNLLGSDQLRGIYEKSNVTDPTKFLQLFAQLREGKGELLQNKDVVEMLQQLASGEGVKAKTDNINAAGNTVVASLETSNDIIQRINESLAEFSTNTNKMRDIPLGITQYGDFGTKTAELDKQFAPKLDAIRARRITGKDAQAILDQYDKSRASYTAMPQTLQQLVPLAQDLGLNTKGLEQRLYNIGSEGQGQLVQRFGQAQQSNQFVQDYESRQRALKQYESSDLYKARDAAVLKEHDNLKKALATDQARYAINKQYLELVKAQANVLLDQADTVEKQNQTRQLISAGTPAQFNPLSIFNTQGFNSGQINKAIEAALEKQSQLEKLSPGYRKYFGEQQFLLQGRGGFKPVTGIDQGFLQEALQAQQAQLKPPSLEDLSQFSDTELQGILQRARSLQGQAVAMNPDLADKYGDERIMIYRKNNQLLQEVGLSQEYLKLAIQENTKSNDSLRGHYNLPSSYRAPTVWDYYANGGKETGNVNFPNQTAQGSMVPLTFAQQLAQEILNSQKSGGTGADLSQIATTQGPGGAAKPKFYSGGSPAIYSEPVPQVIPDSATIPRTPIPNARLEIEAFKRDMAQTTAATNKQTVINNRGYDAVENARLARTTANKPWQSGGGEGITNTTVLPPGWNGGGGSGWGGALDKAAGTAKTGLDNVQKGANTAGKSMTSLHEATLTAGAAMKGLSSISSVVTGTQAFSGAVTALIAKVQQFDLAKALRSATVQINVVVGGQRQEVQSQTINAAGGGTSALTGAPTAKAASRIS